MTRNLDELIVSFIDGALNEDERRAFVARLSDDGELSDRVASHRWLTRQVIAAFPTPRDYQEADAELAKRFRLAPLEPSQPRRISRLLRSRNALMSYAIAASLLVGLFIGRAELPDGSGWAIMERGKPTATGTLARALSFQKSGDVGQIRIALSFPTDDGVCRAFYTQEGISGLACRNAGRWILEMMQRNDYDTAATTGEFRLASGGVAPAVMTEVDRRISDEPITPERELSFIATDWDRPKKTIKPPIR